MMFDKVFWSARDTVNPTIPETVRNENSDAIPITLRIPTPANVTQRRVNPSRILRASPACPPGSPDESTETPDQSLGEYRGAYYDCGDLDDEDD